MFCFVTRNTHMTTKKGLVEKTHQNLHLLLRNMVKVDPPNYPFSTRLYTALLLATVTRLISCWGAET